MKLVAFRTVMARRSVCHSLHRVVIQKKTHPASLLVLEQLGVADALSVRCEYSSFSSFERTGELPGSTEISASASSAASCAAVASGDAHILGRGGASRGADTPNGRSGPTPPSSSSNNSRSFSVGFKVFGLHGAECVSRLSSTEALAPVFCPREGGVRFCTVVH